MKKDAYLEQLSKGIKDELTKTKKLEEKTTQRILICGDRAWKNRESVARVLEQMVKKYGRENILVIEGGAEGADSIGREEALRLGITVCTFHANWKWFGKAAGPIRNTKQLKWGRPDRVYAFHKFLPNSKGTKDMVKKAEAKGVKVLVRTS